MPEYMLPLGTTRPYHVEGRPLAPGDTVELTTKQVDEDPYVKALVEEEILLPTKTTGSPKKGGDK